jgi:hypothetical protein
MAFGIRINAVKSLTVTLRRELVEVSVSRAASIFRLCKLSASTGELCIIAVLGSVSLGE